MTEPNDPSESQFEYRKAHRPAREFTTRTAYLENELQIMRPRRWRLNLPKRDFNFEPEDLVPALSGTIGNTVLAAATVTAFATAFGLDRAFVAENVRFELLISALLFVIPVCGLLNPRVNLPGTHGPMLPLVAVIVAAGGHPLALGLTIGLFGLALGLVKGGSRLVSLTGASVRAGLLIILGMMGAEAQLVRLREWSVGNGGEDVFFVTIIVTIFLYAILARADKRWLAIPLCAAVGGVIAYLKGAPFAFVTEPGIPPLSPFYWWGENTGWSLGLPNLQHFIAVIPFALLAVVMWPPDFLGHKIFQELNYPKGSDRTLMDVDDTMVSVSLRQAIGSFLGSGNLNSSWGTYLIPAAIAKRPIPGGAILTGLGCLVVVFLGYPMDIAKWQPVLVIILLVGVFLPLLEAGMAMVQTRKDAEGAGICVFASMLVNPVFGWVFAMMLDNLGVIDADRAKALPPSDRYVIPIIAFIVCTGLMAAVGLIPGIPRFL